MRHKTLGHNLTLSNKRSVGGDINLTLSKHSVYQHLPKDGAGKVKLRLDYSAQRKAVFISTDLNGSGVVRTMYEQPSNSATCGWAASAFPQYPSHGPLHTNITPEELIKGTWIAVDPKQLPQPTARAPRSDKKGDNRRHPELGQRPQSAVPPARKISAGVNLLADVPIVGEMSFNIPDEELKDYALLWVRKGWNVR